MLSNGGIPLAISLGPSANGPFGTPFSTPPNPPEKVYVDPFLRSFPGNEGILGGGQKVYVEKVHVLFPPLNGVENESTSTIFQQC